MFPDAFYQELEQERKARLTVQHKLKEAHEALQQLRADYKGVDYSPARDAELVKREWISDILNDVSICYNRIVDPSKPEDATDISAFKWSGSKRIGDTAASSGWGEFENGQNLENDEGVLST